MQSAHVLHERGDARAADVGRRPRKPSPPPSGDEAAGGRSGDSSSDAPVVVDAEPAGGDGADASSDVEALEEGGRLGRTRAGSAGAQGKAASTRAPASGLKGCVLKGCGACASMPAAALLYKFSFWNCSRNVQRGAIVLSACRVDGGGGAAAEQQRHA